MTNWGGEQEAKEASASFLKKRSKKLLSLGVFTRAAANTNLVDV
jgi:hypothetical protein